MRQTVIMITTEQDKGDKGVNSAGNCLICLERLH